MGRSDYHEALLIEHLRSIKGFRYAWKISYVGGCDFKKAVFLKCNVVACSNTILMRDVYKVTITMRVEA